MGGRLGPAPFAIFALIVAIGSIACGSSAISATPVRSTIEVPTQAPPPGGTPGACMAALLDGVLVADERWGVAVADPGTGQVRRVIWPNGFSARPDGETRVLIGASGATVGRIGDHVQIGGGETGGDGSWLACPGTIALQAP